MNTILCGEAVDEAIYKKYDRVYTLENGIPVSLQGLFVKQDKSKEAKRIISEIKAEIEQIYNIKENKGMKHNDFAGYVDDLRGIYEDACVKYNSIYTAVENARRIWKDAKNDFQDELNLTRAKTSYLEAEDAFEADMKQLIVDVQEQTKEIREQLETHVMAFYRADADQLVNNSLVLLESGILTDSELVTMANQFRTNVTMLRMVAKYSGQRKSDDAKRLSYEIEHLGKGEKELKLFDEAVMYGNRCLNQQKNLAEIGRKFFDQSIDGVIEKMHELYAQPEKNNLH